MEESTPREKVLKKIRAALLNKSPDPYPRIDLDSSVYKPEDEDIVVAFAERFMQAGGFFILCENELEFIEGLVSLAEQHKWKKIYCNEDGLCNLLTECEFPHVYEIADDIDVVITSCECLVGRNGSIVISSRLTGIAMPGIADYHIVCARSSQIAPDIKDAMHWIKEKYEGLPSAVSFITGPARTQQIDGTFIREGHGTRFLYLFLIDDKERGFIAPAPDEA